MKKIVMGCFVLSFLFSPVVVQAEVSQADQQAAAQRAYEASASAYNEVAAAPKKVVAQVKKATSQTRSAGPGAAVAVRG